MTKAGEDNAREPIQEISAEAAKWLARRAMILDILNDQQPVDQRHNRRRAAEITTLIQYWCAAERPS